MDDNKFKNTKFPTKIKKALMAGNSWERLPIGMCDDYHIDFDFMKERASIWNDYAEKHGFLPIGSVYTCDKNDPEELYIVIDVFPEGYIDSDYEYDEPLFENTYITMNVQEIEDIREFLSSGNTGCGSVTYGTDLIEYDMLSKNFQEFFKMQDTITAVLNKKLKNYVILCKDSNADYENYYLMKIDRIEYDSQTGQYLAYQNTGRRWLHIGNNAGTYRYFDWQESANDNPCYIHIDEDGILQVRSTPFDFFSYGMFINMKRLKKDLDLNWTSLLQKFKSCNGINEKDDRDPFYKVYNSCHGMILKIDELLNY